MVECKKEGCEDFEAQKVPDHSVLMWNLALAGNWWMQAKKMKSAAEGRTNRHFIVPRDYQLGRVWLSIGVLINRQ